MFGGMSTHLRTFIRQCDYIQTFGNCINYECAYRLSFLGEWYQEEASMSRDFAIFFYPSDTAVEIFDMKTKKTFLKRTRVENLSEADFFVGARVDIFGRKIAILDYFDAVTKKKLAHLSERSFLLIKPDGVEHLGKILKLLCQNGFRITNARMVQFQSDDLAKVFSNSVELSLSAKAMISGPVIGIEVAAENAVENLKKLVGSENPDIAKVEDPTSIRAMYGQNKVKNAVHVSQSPQNALEENRKFFHPKQQFKTTEVVEGSALAIIKPHILKSGQVGNVIEDIVEHGFKVTALKMCLMERANCEEFYEVYRGVLPDFVLMVAQLCSGPLMALELVSIDKNKDTFSEFRKFCGPMHPSVAKALRPNTLRAKYGIAKIANAVHCTDLPEDAILEVEYIFKIVE